MEERQRWWRRGVGVEEEEEGCSAEEAFWREGREGKVWREKFEGRLLLLLVLGISEAVLVSDDETLFRVLDIVTVVSDDTQVNDSQEGNGILRGSTRGRGEGGVFKVGFWRWKEMLPRGRVEGTEGIA